MKTDISDALQSAMDAYLRFFDTTTALGGALFGAMIFLVIRAVGIVRDEDVAKITNIRLLLITGLSAIAMIALGFIAQNVALSFYVELLLPEAFGGCTFPADKEPATFFTECHRITLRTLVWINLTVSAVGMLSISIWFVKQTRRLTNDQN